VPQASNLYLRKAKEFLQPSLSRKVFLGCALLKLKCFDRMSCMLKNYKCYNNNFITWLIMGGGGVIISHKFTLSWSIDFNSLLFVPRASNLYLRKAKEFLQPLLSREVFLGRVLLNLEMFWNNEPHFKKYKFYSTNVIPWLIMGGRGVIIKPQVNFILKRWF
jgi:hypothetical protein